VASDLPVFHEVEGSVALYVPPGDEPAWAEALERIVADETLRAASVARGGMIAGTQTWDRAAEITIAAYKRAQEAA
jgi:glycosyltransferase involved in cell wall biosynthesis